MDWLSINRSKGLAFEGSKQEPRSLVAIVMAIIMTNMMGIVIIPMMIIIIMIIMNLQPYSIFSYSVHFIR